MTTSRFHEHLASSFSVDVDYPEQVSRSDVHDKADIIAQIREATSAPSPLTGYLKDPAVLSAIDGTDTGSSSRTKSQRPSSSTRSREPRTREPHQSSILGLVLAEEEKQAHKLKSLLRSTGDRLNREIRPSQPGSESSKYLVELEAARAKEEIKRHQLQIQCLERDVKRLQADVTLLERQRKEADESASRARDTARKFQMDLVNLQGKEAGRDEVRRIGMHKWFKTGRIEGWDSGLVEGFENGRDEGFAEGHEAGIRQGRKMGRQEGFDEGWEQGRTEERDHALRAFDDFFAVEIDEQDHVTKKQAQKWSDWMRRSTPTPVSKPMWLRRPLYTESPDMTRR
ncbi:hypothetical protein BU15DRAFT_75897 [Melanogaster broomeanus]|nr:hypothetical protein BU15DRAFT_75897 [Melanogaster broomeanus]